MLPIKTTKKIKEGVILLLVATAIIPAVIKGFPELQRYISVENETEISEEAETEEGTGELFGQQVPDIKLNTEEIMEKGKSGFETVRDLLSQGMEEGIADIRMALETLGIGKK